MVSQLEIVNGSWAYTYVPQHNLPWLPDIAPPTNIRNIDPAWETCRVDIYGGQGWDPPRAFTPIAGQAAQTTTTTQIPTMPAVTSPLPANPQPPATSVPSDPSLNSANSHPMIIAVPTPITTTPSKLQDPATSTSVHSVTSPVNVAPSPVPQADKNTGGIGSVHSANNPGILAGLGQTQGDPGAVSVPQPSSSLAGSIRPSIVAVGGQVLTENGPPLTIGGTRVAFSSGSIVVGNGVIKVTAQSPNQQNPNPVAVAGITIAPVQSYPHPTTQIANIGGQSLNNPPGQVIGGQTIFPGISTNIAGTPVILASAGLVIGSTTIPIPSQQIAPPITVVGGKSISAIRDSGNIAIAGSVLSPGQQTTIAGTLISVGPSGLLVGASSIPLTPPAPGPTLGVIGGEVISATGPSGHVILGGSTFTLGQQGNVAVMPVPPIVTVGGQTVSAVGPLGNVAVGGSILTPGQEATILGTPVSVGQSHIMIGSSTVMLPTAGPASGNLPLINDQSIQTLANGGVVIGGTMVLPAVGGPQTTPLPQVGGLGFTPLGNGDVVIGSSTLFPGQQVTIAGTPLALGTGNVVVGGRTYALGPTSPIALPTVGGQKITPLANGNLVIAGSTLSPGQQLTTAGTPISVGTGNVVVGGRTYVVTPPLTAPTSGLVIGGLTLMPGASPITLAGQVVSLGANDNLVVGTRTIAIASLLAQQSAAQVSELQPMLVIGSTTFPIVIPTSNPKLESSHPSAVVIAGSTLYSGGLAITIGNTPVSLGTAGLVIGGSTAGMDRSIFNVNGQSVTASFEYAAPGTESMGAVGAVGAVIYSAFHQGGPSSSASVGSQTDSIGGSVSSAISSQGNVTRGVTSSVSHTHTGGSSRLDVQRWLSLILLPGLLERAFRLL